MNWNGDSINMENDEVLKAFQKAKELNLCPNRIWAVAGENLPKLLPKSKVIPVGTGQAGEKNEFDNHDECTSDFCEYSQRDFTRVEQRHECSDRRNCRLKERFWSEMLDDAARYERSTVWRLSGRFLLDYPRPYMAISHVWADGTGTGAWNAGEVNECLWEFFRDIAQQFQCEGIWWDTLCIPREKAARCKAIDRIQTNYEDARITLVHDHFLRSWEWDPETACFAILMSPWFSRGWTALELAKSRKVKVIFKGPVGPLIKDLDEEIIEKDGKSNSPRQKASQIIKSLRKGIDTLNNLLSVLGSRYTSWAKDIATISALLVDVAREEQQQDTYKNILQKFGRIAPGHLFHNAATMTKEFSWCPAKLFDLPLDASKPTLSISPNGDLEGKWRVIPADPETEKACWWSSTHSLVRRKLQAALRHPQMCWLLAECRPGQEAVPVTRALLVKETKVPSRYQYVGVLYFQEKLGGEGAPWSNSIKEVTISSYQNELEGQSSDPAGNMTTESENVTHPNTMKIEQSNNVFDAEAFNSSMWRGDYKTFKYLIENATQDDLDQIPRSKDSESPDRFKRIPLHLASERGDIRMVKDLLFHGAVLDTRCSDEKTALHRAAFAGSVDVVKELLQNGTDASAKDYDENTALHIAAQMGFAPVAELLITKSDFNSEGWNCFTPLHLAALNGHTSVVEVLKDANVQTEDDVIGWTPLHYAACHGDSILVKLLIQRGAAVDIKDDMVGWTPLHIAAMSGHNEVVNVLLENSTKQPVQDNYGWTPRQFAELNGHAQIAEVLYRAESKDADAISVIEDYWSFMHCKVIQDGCLIIKPLFDDDNDFYFVESDGEVTLKECAVDEALGSAIRSLLEDSANAIENDVQLPPHRGAQRWQRLQAAFRKATGEKECWTTEMSATSGGPEGFAWLLINKAVDDKIWVAEPTPLTIPVKGGNENLIRLLLLKGAGAYIDHRDDYNETALIIAICDNDEAVMRLLLKEGADPNTPGDELARPLCYAVKKNSAIVRLLLEKGADPDSSDRDGYTALMEVAGEGNEAMVWLLLEYGANPNISDSYGGTALRQAARKGNEATIRVLLEAGVDPNVPDGEETAVMEAVARGNKAMVCLLLEAGADPNASDGDGKTALMKADVKENPLMVMLLHREATSEKAKNANGSGLLPHDAVGGSEAVAWQPLDMDVDTETESLHDKRPMDYVGPSGSKKARRLL